MMAVRQLIAWSAAAVLLIGTVYAPLFHVHMDTAEAPLIHAHFPELEVPEDESVVHMERPHSHATARSIDILTTTAVPLVHFDGVLHMAHVAFAELQPCCGFVSLASPRAHAPPALRSLIPRAPPA